MKTYGSILLILLSLSGCTASRLSLAEEPVRITVIQRQIKAIPGSNKTITVRLGDITGRQVLTSVHGFLGGTIVDTVSLREGDVVPLQLSGARYYLKLVELRNLVIGDDFAVFEVSSARPDARDSGGAVDD
ncbi:MAG: hypothetical protein IH989_03155 [Planctomycetes bacterium]|nr:hypothetical protein [Planctomycetota bacterium]